MKTPATGVRSAMSESVPDATSLTRRPQACKQLRMSGEPASTPLLGLPIARLSSPQVVDHVFFALQRGQGGWLLTANLDFLRRSARDAKTSRLYGQADLIVADGMPLVWAAQLQGQPLPERVAGSSLIWALAERAAEEGRSLYLLGGAPGAAQAAAQAFHARWPHVIIAGVDAPRVSSPPSIDELQALRGRLLAARPDILLVGLGSPKQELVINGLREALPNTWMVGVGVSFSFVSGQLRRAPVWMRKAGLEWAHRLSQEPGRLAKRYLIDDAPFALTLFWHSWRARHRPG